MADEKGRRKRHDIFVTSNARGEIICRLPHRREQRRTPIALKNLGTSPGLRSGGGGGAMKDAKRRGFGCDPYEGRKEGKVQKARKKGCW